MNIGIIGGGIAGLTAAFDLLAAGHKVTVYEAKPQTGGLASGFRDDAWEWTLDKFYHHIFASDDAIIGLANEIGMGDDIFFPRPTTSVMYDGRIVPFDSPIRWITFPGFNLIDVARFGFVSAYLRFRKPWKKLEQHTADDWLRRAYGDKIYEMVWRPLIIGKFGPHYKEVNMAWMWARLHVRTPKLGYFKGGFQAFADNLAEVVRQNGGDVRLNSPVEKIQPMDEGVTIITAAGAERYDQVLVTTSPHLFAKLTPELPESYLAGLMDLQHMSAVVMTFALKRPLFPDNATYWLNIPANSPDKSKNDIPFLALVEHTNYIDKAHYGGDHIVYCGDYVTPDHEYMQMSQQEIETKFAAALTKINPDFSPDWIRKSWLFREEYAQPVPKLNHSRSIPALRSPLNGIYFASMSQVYPWDRGTNFAVEIGRQAAAEMMSGEQGR